MAEGFEEGTPENKKNGGGAGGANMDAIAMVGAVIPKCESSPHLASNISAITTSNHISSLGSSSTTATATTRDLITESAKIPPSSPSPSSVQQQHHNQQQQSSNHHHHPNQSQPINLKSEVSGDFRSFPCGVIYLMPEDVDGLQLRSKC